MAWRCIECGWLLCGCVVVGRAVAEDLHDASPAAARYTSPEHPGIRRASAPCDASVPADDASHLEPRRVSA